MDAPASIMGEERGTWRLLMPLLCALTISLWLASSMLRTLFPRTWVATDRGGVAPNSRRFNRRNITSHHISPVSSHSRSVLCLSSLERARAGELSSSRELVANKQCLPSCLHVIVAFSTLGNAFGPDSGLSHLLSLQSSQYARFWFSKLHTLIAASLLKGKRDPILFLNAALRSSFSSQQ